MMKDIDIEDVKRIAKNAGDILMTMRADVIRNAEIKSDGSPVTKADKASSALVIDGLGALTPDIPVISEENDEAENMTILKSADCYWIVDPLDGTRSYIDGYDGFGVHIALIENERPILSVIYFPARNIFYYTDGQKSYLENEGQKPVVITVRDVNQSEGLKVAVSWIKDRQPKQQDLSYEPVPAVGGDRVCEVAVGRADLALIENPFSYWDLAAAHGLLLKAGGDIYDFETGKPIRYTRDKLFVQPCMAGEESVVKKYFAAFKEALTVIQKPRPSFKKKL